MANRPQETLNFKKGYGENFKKLRESRKLTQKEVSQAIGADQQTLRRYESGERKPDTEMLLRIAKYYNVSADYLLGLSENSTVEPDMKAAVKCTGLSEKSIEKLKRINHFNADGSENPDKSFIDILDRFIQSKYFSELIAYWESLHTHSTEWKEKELEEKHWNECGQIAHYSDELRKANELLREAMPILKAAFFANYKDTNAANELYDKIKAAVGGVE